MDRAMNLPKLRDNESEYLLGYVFAVSGPGKRYHLLVLLAPWVLSKNSFYIPETS